LQIPEPNKELFNESIIVSVENMRKCIEFGRKLRENHSISLKKPIMSCTIIHKKDEFF